MGSNENNNCATISFVYSYLIQKKRKEFPPGAGTAPCADLFLTYAWRTSPLNPQPYSSIYILSKTLPCFSNSPSRTVHMEYYIILSPTGSTNESRDENCASFSILVNPTCYHPRWGKKEGVAMLPPLLFLLPFLFMFLLPFGIFRHGYTPSLSSIVPGNCRWGLIFYVRTLWGSGIISYMFRFDIWYIDANSNNFDVERDSGV